MDFKKNNVIRIFTCVYSPRLRTSHVRSPYSAGSGEGL
nr:MAG TPA: hypothetical protein [Bacteriophage sp.]